MTARALDKYEVLRTIGSGGMGTVVEAREVESGRRVAIKSLRLLPRADEGSSLARFKREGIITSRLHCPHIVNVYEHIEEKGTGVIHLVMELLEGEDLRSLLKRVGALEPNVALRIAAQAAAGLAAAHKANVVHRDIKPDNLFLTKMEDGSIIVKVLDFGIAKQRRSGDGSGSIAAMNSMTQSGEMLGTPLYMSPEQFEGARRVDARTDVYSMGMTLYSMLVGNSPLEHFKSFLQILRATMTGSIPALAKCAPWVAPEIIAVVEKAMQRDRDLRYPDGTALHEALVMLLNGQTHLREEMLVSLAQGTRERICVDVSATPFDATVREGAQGEAATVQAPSAKKRSWWKRFSKP